MKKSTPATSPDDYAGALTGWQRQTVDKLRAAVLASASLSLTWFERDGIVYTLQENPDPSVPWTASTRTPTLSPDQTNVPPGYRRMQVLITLPEPASLNRLFRVQATKAL